MGSRDQAGDQRAARLTVWSLSVLTAHFYQYPEVWGLLPTEEEDKAGGGG